MLWTPFFGPLAKRCFGPLSLDPCFAHYFGPLAQKCFGPLWTPFFGPPAALDPWSFGPPAEGGAKFTSFGPLFLWTPRQCLSFDNSGGEVEGSTLVVADHIPFQKYALEI